MNETDLETVTAAYSAWNDHDARSWVDRFFAPDCEWHDAPELPDSGIHRGTEEIQAMLRALEGVGGHFDLQVLEVHDAGEVGVVVFRMVGHGDHSGVPLELVASHVVTLREGRVARVLAFLTREDGLRVAGLDAGTP